MKYTTFEHIFSHARMQKYIVVCNGDQTKAMDLYHLNVQVSHDLFSIVCFFEIALRNAINNELSTHFGKEWLKDFVTKRPCAFGGDNVVTTRMIILHEYKQLKKKQQYTHSKLVSKLDFGLWRYLFSRNQYIASGRHLMSIFKYKDTPPENVTYNQKYIFTRLSIINEIRNRIAHHEPICFQRGTDIAHTQIDTTNIRETYFEMLRLMRWMGVPSRGLVKKHDHVIQLCDKIDAL